MLHSKVADYINKHRLINPSEQVAVAFSGGPDSVALLSVLQEIDPATAAVYINHHLRDKESEQEEKFVTEFCASRSIELHIEHLQWKKHPSNLEEEARKRRYRHLAKTAREFHFNKIALAHHRDDAVETFLLRLFRGSGPAGLAPLRPKRGIYIRPMLDCTRAEILQYLNSNSLPYFTDSSNLSLKHRRNRLRLRLIPYIEKNFNPRFSEAIIRTTHWIEEQNILLEELLRPIVEEVVVKSSNRITIDRIRFNQLSDALQKALLRSVVRTVDPSLRLTSSSTGRIQEAIRSGRNLELPGFLVVQFTTDNINLDIKQSAHGFFEIDVPGVGSYLFPPAKAKLQFSLMKNDDLQITPGTAYVDAEKAHFPLVIRNWKKGDTFQPFGMKGHKKLSDYWIDRKVPRLKRKTIPLVFQGDQLVWIAGYTIDEHFRVTKQTRSVMKIEMTSTHV